MLKGGAMSARIRQREIDVGGRSLSFLAHPTLGRAGFRAKLLEEARDLLSQRDEQRGSESDSFKALHAAAFAAAALLDDGRPASERGCHQW